MQIFCELPQKRRSPRTQSVQGQLHSYVEVNDEKRRTQRVVSPQRGMVPGGASNIQLNASARGTDTYQIAVGLRMSLLS